MKVKCNKEIVKRGFHLIENVISSSNVKPILQNVEIKARDDTLKLSTTDLEVSMSYLIKPVEITEPGTVVAPEAKTTSIVKEWTDDDIEITEEDRICLIAGKDGQFKILCADPDEFPTIPQFADEDYIEIDNTILVEMIKKTVFILSGERARYSLNGIFLDIDGDQVKMVANDGRRLAELRKKINNSKGLSSSCIIPVKGVLQMLRIASEHDGTTKIKVEEKRILAKTENSTLCSQLIDGQYPKYEEIIPTNLDKKVILEKQSFLSAVRRSAIMTTNEYKLLRFKFSSNALMLRCNSPDVGESKVEVPVEYSGNEIEIGLNPEFILDFLKTTDTDKIKLELKDPSTAGVFRLGSDHTYVIMPMNLTGE